MEPNKKHENEVDDIGTKMVYKPRTLCVWRFDLEKSRPIEPVEPASHRGLPDFEPTREQTDPRRCQGEARNHGAVDWLGLNRFPLDQA